MGLVSKTWAQYAEITNVHGIPDFHKALSSNNFTIPKAIFWVIVFTACCSMTVWEIYMVFRDYQASPIITTYDLVAQVTQTLPPIEICPTNIINSAKVRQKKISPVVVNYALINLIDYSTEREMYRVLLEGAGLIRGPFHFANAALRPTRVEAFAEVKRIGAVTKMKDSEILLGFALLEAELGETFDNDSTSAHEFLTDAFFAKLNLSDPDMHDPIQKYIQPVSIDYFDLHYKQAIEHNLTDPETGNFDLERTLEAVGYDKEMVFNYCMLGAAPAPCTPMVEPVFDARYGRCWLLRPTVEQTIAGLGIRIEYILRENLAWTDIVPIRQGLRVRTESPFNPTSVKTFDIPPGVDASIRLRVTHYQLNQSEKYGRCQRDIPRNITIYPYTDTVCRLECYISRIIEACGCGVIVPKKFLKPGVKFRSCAETGNIGCLLQYTRHSDEAVRPCLATCMPACEYYDYAPLLSFTKIRSPGPNLSPYEYFY